MEKKIVPFKGSIDSKPKPPSFYESTILMGIHNKANHPQYNPKKSPYDGYKPTAQRPPRPHPNPEVKAARKWRGKVTQKAEPKKAEVVSRPAPVARPAFMDDVIEETVPPPAQSSYGSVFRTMSLFNPDYRTDVEPSTYNTASTIHRPPVTHHHTQEQEQPQAPRPLWDNNDDDW